MAKDREPRDDLKLVSPPEPEPEPEEEETLLGEVACWTHDELINAATLVHNAEHVAFRANSERIAQCSVAIANISMYLPKAGLPKESWERPDEDEVDADPDLAAVAHETIGRLLAEIHLMLEPVPKPGDSETIDYMGQLKSIIEDTLL